MEKHRILVCREKNQSIFSGKVSIIKHLVLLALCFVMILPAYSQTGNRVSGTIVDGAGAIVAGANVKVKGTTRATITNGEGKFSIEAGAKDKLEISFIGFASKEITVGTTNTIKVTLQEDSKAFEEVVVVGYGTQKKVTLTGAVSAISNKEIITTKNENVMNMMTGKIPGVRVVQKSAEPGAFNNTFDIRGLGAPLVIIDGVARDNFTRMDPNEIESISVLKDASAAIYGVRAANGVVLITTKKGSSSQNGKFDLNYTYNYGGQKAIGLPLGTDAIGYMTLMNEKLRRNFQSNFMTPLVPQFDETVFEAFRSGERVSSDWGKLILSDFAPQKQHSLSMNGANDKISYFFNVGYLDQVGIFKSGDLNYNKWNYRANIDAKITSRLRTEFKTSAVMETKNDIIGGSWNVFKTIWNLLPSDAIYANQNPDYPGICSGFVHPALAIESDKTGYNQTNTKWVQSSLALVYDIPYIKGLNARAMYSYDYKNSDNKEYRKAVSQYSYDPANQTYISTIYNNPSKVNRSFSTNTTSMMQLSLNYDRSFNQLHNVKAMMVYEEWVNKGDNFNASRELALDVDQLYAGNVLNQIGSMDINGLYHDVNKSLIGRVNYDFGSKYMAELSVRRDGSSRFNSTNQYGVFPAGSVGWRVSEESFIKEFDPLSFITNLKLRGSYGVMGDDGQYNYQFLTGYDYPSGGYVFGGNYINGVGFRGIANPNITWSTSKTADFGVDVDLWSGLLGFQFDYFKRNREGLLGDRIMSLPGTLGASLPKENLNKDQTLGYEIVLIHKNKVGDLRYFFTGNMSITREKLIYKEQARAGNSYENWKSNESNRFTNIWWGKTYAGQYQTYDEIYNNSINGGGGNQNSIPGDYYYKDLNGDGVLDGWDDTPIATKNTPKINYGFTIGGDYKGFDLSLLFQGTAMVYVEYQEQLAEPLCWDRNALELFMDRWHTEDPNADIFDPSTKWVAGQFSAVGNGSVRGTGSRSIQDASYIRLKSAEIGYSVPKKWLNKVGITAARVYMNGYNLFTITDLEYIDPEHPGDELYGYIYPLNKTYNVGFNITF